MPLDAAGNLLFVRQYRHAAGLDMLELPAGTLDEGEAPDACASREVREETGMAAGKLEPTGRFLPSPPAIPPNICTSTWPPTCIPIPLEADADEFLIVERVPVTDALEMCARR